MQRHLAQLGERGRDPELRADLDEFRKMGVQLALDDFGKRFSSLTYLQEDFFDEIKVDRAFVQDLALNAYSRKIVVSVVGIASVLGATPIAEGIETKEQS